MQKVRTVRTGEWQRSGEWQRGILAGMLLVPSLLIQPWSHAQMAPLEMTIEPDLETMPPLITPIQQISDVQPTDWAFQALQALNQRYGCLGGYPDSSFRGDRALTRFEFAAGLNFCLDQIRDKLTTISVDFNPPNNLTIVQRLNDEFSVELATIKERLNSLESKIPTLNTSPFSATTKLGGQAIFAVNAGGFSSDRIIAPRGAIVSDEQPNLTSLYRVSVDLNTSFVGNDLFKVRLLAASPGIRDNAAGFLEPNLSSNLDWAFPGNSQLSIARLYYTFAAQPDLRVTVGTQMIATDFVDFNRYSNLSFRDFSTTALVNNTLLFPRPFGAGAAIAWNPKGSPFSVNAVYIASNAQASLPGTNAFFGGGGSGDIRLFPAGGGGAKGGLLGDPYVGTVELNYAPSPALTLRLQYSAGEVLGSHFQGWGVNADLALTKTLGLFARYGNGNYPDTILGDLHPQYWSAGLVSRALLIPNDLAGIGIAQPFILDDVGNATQTNFEAFYNIPLSPYLRLTPLVQVISNPANQRSNGMIVTGTLRTVFSF